MTAVLDRTKAPQNKPMEHFAIPVPERRILNNGTPLNILRVGSEDVIRFDILVRGGQWQQELPLQAMFTNRMLREGTASYTSQQIASKLDYYGAWLDLSSSVNYGFITLYSLVKYFPQTLEIVASMVKEPLFPEKELDVVRNVNRQQFLVNADRVEVLARKELNRSLFGTAHPLGKYAALQDYDTITAAHLRNFYTTYYTSANSTLYVSGKVTDDILRCVEQHFGQESWGSLSSIPADRNYEAQTIADRRVFIERPDALQSSVKMGCFTLDRLHPDFLKFKVLVTLFGGYFGSRLMSNIREDKGYTYGIASGVVSYPGTGMFIVSTEAANEYVRPLIAEVYTEIDRLQQDLVPAEELEMVKNYMLGDLCRAYEGPLSVTEAWIFTQTAGLPDSFYDQSVQAIRTVTAEELRRLAQLYFDKERLIEVVAGKKML